MLQSRRQAVGEAKRRRQMCVQAADERCKALAEMICPPLAFL